MGETMFSELIWDILLQLPVKSLLRFRGVSKSWQAMIDSEDFIKAHLQYSVKNTNTNRHHVLLSRWLKECPYRTHVCSMFLDKQDSDHISMKQLHHPLNAGNIRSSCNGLLWLSNCQHPLDDAIWNPFTRKYRRFSSICTTLRLNVTPPILEGFGYDHLNNDYKVVSVLHKYAKWYFRKLDDPDNQVWLYSLRLNSWRRVGDFPYRGDPIGNRYGTFAHGALHWFVKKTSDENSELLVAFDLLLENFSLLPFPDELVGCEKKFLATVGECLCICVEENTINTYSLWIMKEYGVGKSWTKLCSTRDVVVVSSRLGGDKLLLPLNAAKFGFLSRNIRNTFELKRFNVEEETGDVVSFDHMLSSFSITMCIESLVPV